MAEEELEQKVIDMLLAFKIQPDIMGFDYLKSAIMMCYQQEGLKNNISKKIYPMVAKSYNATPETVERGMRTAVENCFNCGGLLEINEKCGRVVYNNNFKWTNGEVICTLAQLIKIEEGREKIKRRMEELKTQHNNQVI